MVLHYSKNINDLIPSLVINVKLLEAKLLDIVDRWIKMPLFLDVMQKHEIEPEFFKNEYAIKLFEYFFAVVKGEKEVGECPAIDKLLLYLKNNDISADELFIICTHARKSLVNEAFIQNIATYQLISDIGLLFDLNFSGILKKYANTIYMLEKQVKVELEKNRKKDTLILQQSRMAQMGEMISMIAHQWRQPISIIGMAINNLKLDIDLGEVITDENFEDLYHTINAEVQHLSQTIDDFRNFYKPIQQKNIVNIGSVINTTMGIIDKSLINSNIEVTIQNSSLTEITTYTSQLLQVFLNIIKNAKDNLLKREIKEAKISIDISETDDSILTSICDNGGGISKHDIERIGEPYFTTKGENGMGLGLYMSKTIVEKNLQGRLSWKNENHGACFVVSLPKQ